MRLIDADALNNMLSEAQAECKRNGGHFRFGVLSNVRENIAKQPTIDAIQVEWIKQVEAKGFDYMHCEEVILGLWEKEQEVR